MSGISRFSKWRLCHLISYTVAIYTPWVAIFATQELTMACVLSTVALFFANYAEGRMAEHRFDKD